MQTLFDTHSLINPSDTVEIVRDALQAGVLNVGLTVSEFNEKLDQLSLDDAVDYVQHLWDML
jgi:hypothetical protein